MEGRQTNDVGFAGTKKDTRDLVWSKIIGLFWQDFRQQKSLFSFVLKPFVNLSLSLSLPPPPPPPLNVGIKF